MPRSAANGGALYFETSGNDRSWTGRVENCVFTQNAAANGGGIYFLNRSSTAYPGLVVSNSLFRANRTTGSGYGSAINVYRQVATHLTDCLIEGPQPAGAGAVLYAFLSLCRIDRCTIRNNRNDQANGLCFFYSCNTSVRNTLLHGNTSSSRGLLNLHESGALTAENCTLVSNAYGTAGAINLRAYDGGTATVYNAVIVSNAGAVAAGTEGVAHFTNSCVSSAQASPTSRPVATSPTTRCSSISGVQTSGSGALRPASIRVWA